MITGKEAENIFISLMKEEGEIIIANKDQDMFEHWDIECNNIKYDVKTEKKLNRSDENTSDIIWIELKNVHGNPGWIKGKADKISFLIKNKFLIIDREKLLLFMREKFTDYDISKEKKYMRLYRRSGRKDLITFIYPKDILHLVEREIDINF